MIFLVMSKPVKIFLGDLTYNTVSLATDAFPLNVGFIASYCKKLFHFELDEVFYLNFEYNLVFYC